VAELLASRGAEVEFVTPNFAPVSPRVMAAQDARFIMQRLRATGVKISPCAYVERIGDREVVLGDVYSDQTRIVGEVVAVVLAASRVPVNGLERELDGQVAQLFTVGDAAAARMWGAAAYEGHLFARYIGEPDAPRSIGEVYFAQDDAVFLPVPAEVERR
jgi:hypothetical protein